MKFDLRSKKVVVEALFMNQLNGSKLVDYIIINTFYVLSLLELLLLFIVINSCVVYK